MTSRLIRLIRHLHLAFDSMVGRLFLQKDSLAKVSNGTHYPLSPENFKDYRYSKNHHFTNFRILPIHKNLSRKTCDLKVYQDSLVYTFILDNFPEGSHLLEIGGGESRIINALKNKYDMWNLDKLEGSGYGPKKLINREGFSLVQDYIGDFSTNLQSKFFDLVFSISTIEHVPQNQNFVDNAIIDIMRLLKPGGYSLHCIDALLFEDCYFLHPFAKTVHDQGLTSENEISICELKEDEDIWLLPAYAFYTRWFHIVKKPLRAFGHPFSVNLLWQKTQDRDIVQKRG